MQIRKHALLFSLVLASTLALSGCQRQRAEISLRKTAQTLTDIREVYEGTEHEPAAIEAVQSKVDQANQLLATDAGQALEIAKQANNDVNQLLEQVKVAEANDVYVEADNEIKIADINDLPRIDNARYSRIRELFRAAQEARNEQDWDTVINRSREIIQEVDQGLFPLVNDVERRRDEARQELVRLRQVGGTIFAAGDVALVEDIINNAERIAEEDREYQLALNEFQRAITTATEGVNKVLAEKSRQELEKVESELTTALIEGARDYMPDQYDRAFSFYEQLQGQYQEGAYTAVLEGVDDLQITAQRLVIDTKRAASDERIQALARSIEELREDNILTYMAGSLEELNNYLAQVRDIRQQDTEDAFDRIKELSIEAREEFERVKGNYLELAQDEIRAASNQLETTRTVFEQMEEIFRPVEGPMDPEQQVFENLKDTRQREYGETLERAARNLNVADMRRQQEQISSSIELAKEVEQTAEMVLSEVYHTVAHNASIELAKLISRYERDGARQYAPQELARSTDKLEDVKQEVQQGDYKRAVELAAEARADVELMAQRIAGRATENLRDARGALSDATSVKTQRYRADMLRQIAALVEEAEVDLQAERLKIALEKAQRATALAAQAVTEANLLAAKDQIDDAQNRLSQAQEAGAELYAGREIEDARRLLRSSRALFASEDYVKAEELAVSAGQRARNALYKKVDEADAAIATAKAVGGWEYQSGTLARANTLSRESLQALEDGRYTESELLAQQAREIALGLSDDAKDANFARRVARIRDNLEEGTQQGINFFQPEDSIAIRRQLAQLENQYTRDDYERVMTEIEKIEAALRLTLDETDELVATVAAQQGSRLERLVGEGATQFATAQVADARDALRYALLDYRRGLYKSAHSNLDRAINLIDNIAAVQAAEAYAEQVQGLFAEYRDIQDQFSNVLSLNPVELKELAVGPGGAAQSVAISAQISPNQFRDRLDELYSRALIIQAPAGMERLHESVIRAFSEARLAAMNFEKLAILNRMGTSEAYRLIDGAYQRLNASNRIITQVQRQLIADARRARTVANASSVVNMGN